MKRSINFTKVLNLEILIILLVIIYGIIAATVSINRYWQYQSFYFDFGIFDSAIWNVAHFKTPLISHVNFGIEKKIIFADHFNPSIFLLSPLYWFTSYREILLVAQTVIVCLSVLIGFNIAKSLVKNKPLVFGLVAAYLGYVGLQNALISDLHDATLLTLPLMVLFWSVIKSKWFVYFICLLIILGLKETFAGLGVSLGLFVILHDKRNLKIGLCTILISIVWYLTITKLVIPFFSGDEYFYAKGVRIGEAIANLFYPSIKLKTIFFTYLTFGFLPILNISLAPAIFENFLERFVLSSDKRWDLGLHYNAPLAPLMFMSSVLSLRFIEKKIRISQKYSFFFTVLLLIIVLILHKIVLRGPLDLFFNPVFYKQNQGVKYVDNLIEVSPKDGLIMTQNDLALRFSHEDVVLLSLEYRKVNPKHVILNLTPGQNPNSFFPLNVEQVNYLKEDLIKNYDYNVTKITDYQYIFSKK